MIALIVHGGCRPHLQWYDANHPLSYLMVQMNIEKKSYLQFGHLSNDSKLRHGLHQH